MHTAGATRECVFDDGGRIEEEIVDYEFGAGYAVNFVDVLEGLEAHVRTGRRVGEGGAVPEAAAG